MLFMELLVYYLKHILKPGIEHTCKVNFPNFFYDYIFLNLPESATIICHCIIYIYILHYYLSLRINSHYTKTCHIYYSHHTFELLVRIFYFRQICPFWTKTKITLSYNTYYKNIWCAAFLL